MKYIICFILSINLVLNTYAQGFTKAEDAVSGKYGLKKGNHWAIPAIYESVYWNSKDELGTLQKEKNDREAIINQNGHIITDFLYTNAYSLKGFSAGHYVSNLICVCIDDLEGIINRKGEIIVPCIYTDLTFDKDGFGVRSIGGKWGLLDLNGKVKIEPQYSNRISASDFDLLEYKIVNIGGKCTNEDEMERNPVGGKWGCIDGEGRIIVPFEYDDIESFYYDFSLLKVNVGGSRDAEGKVKGGQWGVRNKDVILVPPIYDDVAEAAEHLYAVCKGGKWGLYTNDKEIVPCQYDDAPKFDNEVATVRINGQVKLIKNPLKDASKIQIASGDKSSTKKAGGPVISRYPAPDSDVDKNIPVSKKQAENTFAFIIANENYADAPVPYSLNDGRMFKEYCLKTLGLPEKNINMYEDATFGTIITAVEKMKQLAEAYEGEASVIFYYAGHGFPDEKQSTAYLLPVDGDASSITTTGYSLAKLYTEISKLKLKSSVVFLDACFSGAKREDQMLASSRGVAIKVKDEAPQGNMVVFSAAQGDETAHQMEDKHHGLFTYFLLKELQATGGDVDMGTLTEYVTKQVKRQSVVINNKKQTPTVIPSQALVNSWKTMKLK